MSLPTREKMNNGIELLTDRLQLRPWTREDASGLVELNADPEVLQFTGDAPFQDLDEAVRLIEAYDQFKRYRMGRFTMINKISKEYMGWCGLRYDSESGETDLGFRLLKRFRNQGYATEASVSCLEYGFHSLGLARIIGRAVKENKASIAVLRRLGMKFEKNFNAHGSHCEQYSITLAQWNEMQGSAFRSDANHHKNTRRE